jgi:hypothetical protein
VYSSSPEYGSRSRKPIPAAAAADYGRKLTVAADHSYDMKREKEEVLRMFNDAFRVSSSNGKVSDASQHFKVKEMDYGVTRQDVGGGGGRMGVQDKKVSFAAQPPPIETIDEESEKKTKVMIGQRREMRYFVILPPI